MHHTQSRHDRQVVAMAVPLSHPHPIPCQELHLALGDFSACRSPLAHQTADVCSLFPHLRADPIPCRRLPPVWSRSRQLSE